MKKLRLQLDDLQIETFDPTPLGSRGEGTVMANSGVSCMDYNGTCGASCNYDPLGGCAGTAGCPGGGGSESGIPSCACPTANGCVYPSTSCADGQTYGEATCYCQYPYSDARVCCSDAWCSNGMC